MYDTFEINSVFSVHGSVSGRSVQNYDLMALKKQIIHSQKNLFIQTAPSLQNECFLVFSLCKTVM